MTVYTDHGFRGQALLSLQHLWRIGRAKGVKWWTAGVGFIPASDSTEEHIRIAQDLWKRIHAPAPAVQDEDEDDDVDPWDRLNRHRGLTFNDATFRAPIPDYGAVSGSTVPPCFIAQVEALPRDVDIEWSATGLTSTSTRVERDATHPNVTITRPLASRSRFYTLEIKDGSDLQLLSTLKKDGAIRWTNATLYTGRGFQLSKDVDLRGIQWIPCKRVWGEDGREVRGVLVGRTDLEEKDMGRGDA
jgi:diphthine-ammonia ligase